MSGEGVKHVALGFGRKEKLLVVLAVDIGEKRGEILEQRDGHGTAADEGARFSAGQDFALDEQLAVVAFDAGGFEQAADGLAVADVEDSGDAGARFAGADHFGGGAGAEQQAEGIDRKSTRLNSS